MNEFTSGGSKPDAAQPERPSTDKPVTKQPLDQKAAARNAAFADLLVIQPRSFLLARTQPQGQ
jgi:hypothetical protein